MNRFTPKKFGLIIIESLDEKKDILTGKNLFDDVIKYKQFAEPNLDAELYQVETKVEFCSILEKIFIKVKEEYFFPILHLEMHGYEEGIQLKSGEIMAWDEMMPYFRQINIYINNLLTIMLAACKGATLSFRPNPDERAPFRAVVSTLRNVTNADIQIGFEAFYNCYFFKFDPGEAVDCMNKEIGKDHTFGITTAQMFFDDFFDENRNPQFFNQMIDEMALNEKQNNPIYQNISMAIVRVTVMRKILAIFAKSRKNRDYFLMRDLKK